MTLHIKPSADAFARLSGPDFDVAYFLVDEWIGEPYNAEPEEHDDLQWFRPSQIERLELADEGLLPILRHALVT